MPLLLVGVALVALGLFSAAVLVASPFGLTAGTPGLPLWLAFPGFSVAGLLLAMLGGGSTAALRSLAAVLSYGLLLLSLISAAALVLAASGLIVPVATVAPLWFVMMLAGVIGGMGAAVLQKSRELAAQSATAPGGPGA
jgi:hypothetical protein